MNNETLPMVNCFICNAEIPTTEIRQHQANCKHGNKDEIEVLASAFWSLFDIFHFSNLKMM